MKLIFCPTCQDIFKLQKYPKTCECRKSWGKYEDDGLHAIVGGLSIPLGISNSSFNFTLRRMTDLDESNLGLEFTAFLFRKNTPNIKWEDM